MAGRFDENPFAEEGEEEVNPFSVSFSFLSLSLFLLFYDVLGWVHEFFSVQFMVAIASSVY